MFFLGREQDSTTYYCLYCTSTVYILGQKILRSCCLLCSLSLTLISMSYKIRKKHLQRHLGTFFITMSLAGCQINLIDVTFYLQNSLKNFDKNSADQIWPQKTRGLKMPSLMPIRVKLVQCLYAVWADQMQSALDFQPRPASKETTVQRVLCKHGFLRLWKNNRVSRGVIQMRVPK